MADNRPINEIYTKDNLYCLLGQFQKIVHRNPELGILISGYSIFEIIEKNVKALREEPKIEEEDTFIVKWEEEKILTKKSYIVDIFKWKDFLFLFFNENNNSMTMNFQFENFVVSIIVEGKIEI